HHGEDFPAAHGEGEVVVHHVRAEGRAQAADFDDRLGRAHQPTSLKTMAQTASARMTAVIATTTEAVVPRPRLSVLGSTRKPKWQAMSAISTPNKTPLPSPIQKLPRVM